MTRSSTGNVAMDQNLGTLTLGGPGSQFNLANVNYDQQPSTYMTATSFLEQ